MKHSTDVVTSKREPGSGNTLKGSPLKNTLKSGNSSTSRENKGK